MSDQFQLFNQDELDDIMREWQAMPEFSHQNLEPWKQLIVSFACPEDLATFARLVEQPIQATTRSIWYPAATIESYADKRYNDEPSISGLHYLEGEMGEQEDGACPGED